MLEKDFTQIDSWLKTKESAFFEELKRLGQIGQIGYEILLPRNKTSDCFRGTFTGLGLCRIATASLEEGLIKKFRNTIITAGMFIRTYDKDVMSSPRRPHHCLGVEIFRKNAKYDATYKQFSFRRDLHIERIRPEHENYFYPGMVVERVYESGEVSQNTRDGIKTGKFGNIKIRDYERLVKTLID